jgi:hypothetical protein
MCALQALACSLCIPATTTTRDMSVMLALGYVVCLLPVGGDVSILQPVL